MILQRLAQVVAERPLAPAVIDRRSLDYQTLWDAAGGVARWLQQRSINPGELVAVEAERSTEWIIAVLGVWMAGAAWMPLDPLWPQGRRDALIRRAHAKLVLAPPLPGHAPPEPLRFPKQSDLAYVIATSGSTGQPKLVELTHRGLVPFLEAQIAAFELQPGDRSYWMLSPVFDATVSDVFTALLAGATVVVGRVQTSELVADWRRHRVTHVDLPPALMSLLNPEHLPDTLRTVVFGGEPSPPAQVRAWAQKRRLVQAYGPTEATVCTHLAVVDPSAWDAPYLGQPIGGMVERVEGDELWLSGPGLARGYRGDPTLTEAKFVFRSGQRWYRTGDRVQQTERGPVYRGRVDRQIKLAGRLIAPEEIEALLLQYPSVRRAVVRAEGYRLVAYLEGEEDNNVFNYLLERLPAWMVPAQLHWQRLPELSSGKVDQEALKVSGWQRRLGQALRKPIGPETSFFEAGGDSLAILELLAQAEADGVALDVETLHRHPTPRALAQAVLPIDRPPGALLFSELQAQLPPLLWPPAVAPESPQTLFLTGATGFLGVHLLSALRGSLRVVALVRDPATVSERIRRAQERYGIEIELPTFIQGDLSQPLLGLSSAEYDHWAQTCDRVVHCAGQLSLTEPLDHLWPANVEGVANMLRFSNHLRPKALVHAGSLVVLVAGDGPGGVLLESEAPQGRWLLGGYAQSKWLAETLLLRAQGAPVANVRLGLLVGNRATFLGAPDDWLGHVVRAFRQGVPELPPEACFDAVPVDHAASVLARLAVAPLVGAQTFHVAAQKAVRADDLRSLLGSAPATPLGLLAARHRRSPFDLFLATGVRFDTRRTEAVTGLVAPALDFEALSRYVSRILEVR